MSATHYDKYRLVVMGQNIVLFCTKCEVWIEGRDNIIVEDLKNALDLVDDHEASQEHILDELNEEYPIDDEFGNLNGKKI